MRTPNEINAEIDTAMSAQDVGELRRLAQEMQALGTPQAVADALNALVAVDRFTGDYPSALEHLRRALVLKEELGDRRGVAIVTGNIAGVYFNTGDYPATLEYSRRAMAVHEELGDRAGVARATGNMGNVYQMTGDYPSALEHYRRALALREEVGDRVGMAYVTAHIGIVYADTGDYPSALEHYRQAVAMHEELGNQYGSARVMVNLIEVLIEVDQHGEAAELLEQQASMQINDPEIRAGHASIRASLAEHREDMDAAREHLQQALEIASEAGVRAEAVRYHKRLRDVAQKRNDFQGYIEHNNEYQRITEEIRGKEATQKLAMQEAEQKMEGERRERDKERAILYSTLPSHVADRLIRGEDVSGDHFDHASVMFLDIVGFTTNSHDLEPRVVTELLDDVFNAFDERCEVHNVTKIKTIGDAYLAVAFPADDQSAEQNIASVALAIQQLQVTWPDKSPLQFRIGLHSGPVVAGVIGKQRLQYDVWGDTVNVASRMESSSEPGRIHVSSSFAIALKGETAKEPNGEMDVSLSVNEEPGTWHLAPRGTLEVKGKGMMKTFWLE